MAAVRPETKGLGDSLRAVAPVLSGMDRNVGGLDRALRVAAGLALLAVGYRNRDRTLGALAAVAGGDLLATAVVQRCPVNAVLGIDTCG
ncbi:hypothetical protein C492_05665 [Natronococcus jeotgali DSM 18795]|uniref:Inner membrane protein YgaP-like transmembrane domain-containing protein n=2 Tax=Natronococcus jeotgali TaxID=413812 RepID=L9XSK1_9EURY|nr:hypothetical protein C492_05665 [Natronococcus jeotgali DSM 18795]